MRLLNLSPVILLALASALSAQAKVVFTSGHWSLDDLSDSANPNGQCIMFSQEDNRGTVWRLEIAHAKNIASTTELQLRQQGKGPLSWTAPLRSGKVLAFASLGKSGNADLIWNLPQGLRDIVYQFEVSDKPVELKAADGTRTTVRFDEKGFRNVKAEMVKRCLGGGNLVDQDFEASFFKDTGRTLDPNAVNAQTVAELKSLLGQAYKVTLDSRANTSSLNQLEARFAPQTSERNSLSAEISDLNARILPGLQRAQLDNNALEAQNNTLLTNMNTLIPQQEAAVTRAAAVRDRAQSDIAPFVDEHDARVQASDRAHRDANSASNRIGEIDRSVGNLNQQIGGLQVTRDNAILDARRLRMDLPRARQDAEMADLAYRSFRLENEVHQRMDHDPRYAQLQAQFKPARVAADLADAQRAQAQRDLDQRSRELVACARGGAPTPAPAPGPGPGRNPDRPGRPRPGQPDAPQAPTEATPAPAPDASGTVDCSAQTAAVQAAQANFDQAKRNADALDAQADGLERGMAEIERNARRDAAAFQVKLQEDARRASERYNGMLADMENDRRTAESIDQVQIPQLRGQISDLYTERTTREAQLNAAATEAARQDNDLALFEQRVGWKAKSDALTNAAAALDARTTELARSRNSRQAAQTGLANCAQERTRLTNLQADNNALLKRDQDRLVVVNTALVPYDQEKSRLNQVGAALSSNFQDLSVQFDAKLPH